MDPRPVSIGQQTWAIPPSTEIVPPAPNLPLGRRARLSSSSATSFPASSVSDEDEEDTYRPGPSGGSAARRLTAYEFSFDKPTFQWIRGELLGKGSYGRVYLGLNATTGEVMAVKQVELPKTASDKLNHHQIDVMKALKFEGDTLKDLNHPNIVTYLGFEESQDHLSIFLEYVPGGTLGLLLQNNGRLREEVTKFFLNQIIKGLGYLHEKHILHRDLKSENILIDHGGTCKITDFGISKKAGDIRRGKAYTRMKGTVFWMAPEVIINSEGYDFKVDIWSVGCLAVEMWTGHRPWFGQEMMAVMYQLANKAVPPIPEDIPMSQLAQDFRSACFQLDPDQRPSSRKLWRHNYLKMPPGWIFNPDDVADNSRPPRTHQLPAPIPDRTLTSYLRESKSSSNLRSPNTERPKVKPSLPTLQIPTYTKSPVEIGPPLVFITPPGSPRRFPKHDQHSASTSTSGTPDRKHKRVYIISNPDDHPGHHERPSLRQQSAVHPKPYTYTPPPLPEPNRNVFTTTAPKAIHKAASMHFRPTYSSSNSSLNGTSHSPSRSLRTLMPESATSMKKALSRPLPVPNSPPGASRQALPALPSHSLPHSTSTLQGRPSSSRDRSYTLTSLDTSALSQQEDIMGSSSHTARTSTFTHLPIPSSTSANTGTRIRRLPISPQPSSTNSPSRSLAKSTSKQPSIPDVSIFAYNPQPRPQKTVVPRKSFDSDFDQDGMQSDSSISSTSTTRNGQAGKIVGHTERRDSLWAMRPRTEDVYEDLEAWFPNIDLDQPVDSSTVAPTTPSGTPSSSQTWQRNHEMRKSIRAIAKEQNRLSHSNPGHTRRRTMLWNSSMKELKNGYVR